MQKPNERIKKKSKIEENQRKQIKKVKKTKENK